MKLTEMIQMGALGFKPADIKKFGESGIESKDIIELAKSGYTANDVDELIKLSQESADTTAKQSTEEKPPEGDPGAVGDDTSDDNIDNKTDPDPKDAEIEKLKAEISKMQDANAHTNIGQTNTISAEEKFQEALKGLY